MGSEMDTFAARLASFDLVLKPEKRRSSGAKAPKAISWPHQRPSPAELAHAGFFYKPYETNPDNTTCFECHRALDGWEEEDNPITEHLKHAPDCGWAIMMDIQQNSSNPSSIEDPTNERITQARASTFGSAWPHDGKRGWVCQSEKMVEGGWYFCPTEESNDLASCAYCKLSLDGWEPKDDPFEEHYRRSSDCSFFVFAQPPGKKGKGRTKKPRVSKASSRLSTQSVGTVASETPEVDMDDSMDQSMMSQSTTKSKSTKKSSKGKGKGAKSKKEEPAEVESHMETESAEVTESEPAKAKHTGRGKKRASEDITKEDPKPIASEEPEQAPVEPPAKRRATRTRSSSISRNYNYDRSDSAMLDADTVDEGASEEETKRGRKPTKKGASRARKVSDVSVTSKPVSKARIPRDSEIEAEIEAGLDADIPESIEAQHEPEPEPEPEQPRVSKKAKATKKSKAVAKSPEPTPQEQTEDAVDEDHMESEAERVPEEVPEPPAAKNKTAKGSKKKGSKKAKAEETKAESQEPQEPLEPLETVKSDDKTDSERHESFISVEIINKEPEPSLKPEESVPEPDDSEKPAAKPKRKGSKKKDASVPKEKKSKKLEKEPTPPPESPIVEHDVEPSVDEPEDGFETVDDLPDQLEVVQPPQESSPQQQRSHRTTTNFPPKTAKRYSDIPQEEHLAETIAHSSPYDTQQSNRAVSPLPSAHRSTPSMSPQSSDAENRPPSSRPSASRANDQSTPQEPKFRAALTASTPSPSKRNANAGFGPSGQPWTPIDIDDALFGDNSDKENADLASLFKSVKGGLTSPEKKMTVQEWIAWNAKNGEERLKRECERLVGQFEKEGGRAMQRIEAIECID